MYRVNQHLTVLNLYTALINEILVTEFMNVSVSQNLFFDVKYTNTVKSTT